MLKTAERGHGLVHVFVRTSFSLIFPYSLLSATRLRTDKKNVCSILLPSFREDYGIPR
jgi:hypothetical protein